MSTRKQPTNFVQRLLKRVWRSFNVLFKTLLNGVLRGLRVSKRRSRQSQAGFVLPTVVMVVLVVALLTTAIVIRSFDRAKNASNYRVDQAVLNAATPALDRARAKIERLFSTEENRLTATPAPEGLNYDDTGTISEVLSQKEYIFGDETLLKVVYDIDGNNTIQKKEQIKTAWKFPTDTDNNGKFDSFTLYGIYFRNPLSNENRARSPLEARARPQVTRIGSACETAGNGGGSDTQGWYETDGQLKKAFFTYVANVPIAKAEIDQIPAAEQSKYEVYSGNKSFSALEMQQDQGQISLDNNAVWYNDDLVISNVPTFRLNGRVHTNSNLMVANSSSQDIVFYQVSSVDSCYYTAENAKIIVGGHVVAGDITGDAQGNATDSTETLVKVHLFNSKKNDGSPLRASDLVNSTPPGPVFNVNADNKTTNFNPAQIATNSNAYETRLNALVNEAVRLFNVANPNGVTAANVEGFTRFPDEVKANFKAKFGPTTPASAGASILKQVLNTYFAERLRRVSYDEVAVNADPLGTPPWTTFTGTGIQPPVAWMLYDPSNPAILPVKTASGGAGIELEATIPPSLLGTGRDQQEQLIGDRILVGNSLPRKWWQPATGTYAKAKQKQEIPEQAGRYREGLVEQLDDLGDTSRGGYWERAAALSGSEFEQPSIKELAGGLRVVTGAGIYIDGLDPAGGGTGRRGVESFLPPPPTALELKQMADADPGSIKLPKDIRNATPEVLKTEVRVVWPDTMPMSEDQNGAVKRGDLQMRATVVYHSAITSGTNQTPIACIATLYDPTSAKTAQSFNGLPTDPDHQVPASTDDPTAPSKGLSINGINYPIPSDIVTKRASANTDLKLVRQANMIFPDGRWVNKPLRDAVLKLGTSQGLNALNIADIAAIDAANCALEILKTPGTVGSSVVPDFAIKEEAFLDARQIKAIHKRDTIGNLPITTQPPYEPGSTQNPVRLKDAGGNYVSRETTREYISNPDKLKIAELGELNLEGLKRIVTNYPFYSLPIEQRQPLEIRVTQIDLDKLRKTKVGTNNYLLPNSGIIYASRDDALPDISDFDSTTDGDKGSSATDFLLDPTRRPNGILLVNGANLLRENDYRIEEKGLILATDLPVYIKSQKLAGNPGGFNLHLKPNETSIDDANVREEFINLVDSDYKDFYNRQAGTNGSGLNPNFACRKGQADCTEGDQWRAARILSDAVTLLSSNFRFGYRNEGDFDLNNNVGNLAVESRLKQGFWWNAFATNGEWVDPANGYPKDFDAVTGTQGSTYVTNGVTPIQRRVNFPEYKMEICRKLPVAACGPGDWKLEIPGNAQYPGTGSGTTARIEDTNPTTNPRYVAPADRRYPRRVAFQRNSAGELIVPDTCSATATGLANCKATPLGPTGTAVPYDGTPVPTAVDNTLWFWTTGDTTNTNPSPVIGTPTLPTDVLTLPPNVSYNKTNKLYYAPYEPEEVSERQLLLPGLPEFPNVLKTATPPVKSLNSSSATNLRSAPSDYAVLNFTDSPSPACNFSKDYKPGGTLPACATDTETSTNLATNQVAIRSAWGQFLTYNRTTNDDEVYLDKNDTIHTNPLPFNPPGGLRNLDYLPANKDTITLKAYAKVNIYSLPKPVDNREVLSGLEITFDSNNRIDDPIFVIRPFDPAQNLTNKTSLQFVNYVKVIPKGVDPNNIFWVPTNFLQIRVHNDANDHELAGNFIGGGLGTESLLAFTNSGGTDVAPTPTKPILNGGRFLGFDPTSVIPTGAMTAMTTAAEPLLIPVLNLHSPQGTPGGNVTTAFGARLINEDYWVQRVPNGVTETYNAVFIMGDSPSRPFTGIADPLYSGESGGGLGNFPRFLEAWQSAGLERSQTNANAKISGSFIQFKRSIFATAPFEAIDDPKQDNSLFFDTPATGIPDYMQPFIDFVTANRPYIYKGGGQLRKAPYYRAPNRAWGYDIGLLKQSPDLFSRRFSTPSAGTPNEYYREVSRDDLWVKTLMCAAEQVPAAAVGAPPTYNQWAIADPKQRPSDCPEPTPPAAKYKDL